MRSESGPCGNVNQRRVGKLRPPSPVFFETAGPTALRKSSLRGLCTGCRTKEPPENDTYLEMFASKVFASAAANWRVNLLRRPRAETQERFSPSFRRGAVSSGHVPGRRWWRRLFHTSCFWKPRSSKRVRRRRCLQTSASPRRDSLYDAARRARRDGVSSVFTSGRRGRRQRRPPLTLPPSPTVSSSLLWFQFSCP